VHKNIWDADWLDILGMICLIGFCILAIAGGVGGGFIYIVIIMFVFNFDTLFGTPQIYVMVFFATIMRFAIDSCSDHPTMEGTALICWDIVLVCMPSMLLGNTLGLKVNIVSPEWLIMILFIIIVLNDFFNILKRYRELTAKMTPETSVKVEDAKDNYKEVEKKDFDKDTFNDEFSKNPLTWFKGALMVLTLVLNIVMSVLRGSNKAESLIGIKFCDPESWVIFAL